MAKSKEYYRKLKKEAHDMYVNDCITCKEISLRIGVSERSISNWINENEGLWKKEQQATAISSKKQGDNIKKIIENLAEKRLQLLSDIDDASKDGNKELELELRKQAASIDDGVSKWGKQLSEIDKTNRITLSIYIDVMTRIFDSLKIYDANLYFQTLDFQENHLYEAAKLLG